MKSTDYYSVLIIASIVKTKPKLDEERPLVASVYLNGYASTWRWDVPDRALCSHNRGFLWGTISLVD